MFGDQKTVDFVAGGVWTLKFFSDEDYRTFVSRFQDCLFENVYGVKAAEENKLEVYGKEFIAWVKPEAADDTVWEDANGDWGKSPEVGSGGMRTPVRGSQDLLEEAAGGVGIPLALGALDNSFLMNDLGVQVVKNFSHGIHGRGVHVKFNDGGYGGSGFVQSTPKKALLMRG